MKIDVYINDVLREELNNKVVGFEIIDNTGGLVDSLKLSINNAKYQFWSKFLIYVLFCYFPFGQNEMI